MISAGGCSLTRLFGTSHVIDASFPRFAAWKKSRIGWMFLSWWSCLTVSNQGSGFQIPGVSALCQTFLQTIPSSSQSGWAPLNT